MIDVATLSVIRRWALREQLSLREIARRTGLSRNTIRKYLREGEAAPSYAKRISPSKLDAFTEKLGGWLKSEASKSRKQRRTLKQMHADLVALGYQGSYNRVAAFARAWHAHRHEVQQTTGRGTFVPLAFGPGEAFQFDWSEDWAVIAGERTKLQVAHFKLSHSRAFIVRAYLLQTHEMLFDAHNRAFEVLGGVPRRGIYDNMKTAVDRVRRGKERDVNARFNAMVTGAGNTGVPSSSRCSTLSTWVLLGTPASRANSTAASTACSSWCRTRTRARTSTISRSPPGCLSKVACKRRKPCGNSTKGAPFLKAPGLR